MWTGCQCHWMERHRTSGNSGPVQKWHWDTCWRLQKVYGEIGSGAVTRSASFQLHGIRCKLFIHVVQVKEASLRFLHRLYVARACTAANCRTMYSKTMPRMLCRSCLLGNCWGQKWYIQYIYSHTWSKSQSFLHWRLQRWSWTCGVDGSPKVRVCSMNVLDALQIKAM